MVLLLAAFASSSCGAAFASEGLEAPAEPAAVPVAADRCAVGVAASPGEGRWVPGLGTVARPVARAGAAPESFPARGVPGPLSEDVVAPGGLAPAGGAGFGAPVDGEPPGELACALAAATVDGVAFGVPGLPGTAGAVLSVDPGVLPAAVRPVVSDFDGVAPGGAGDEESVVTVLREPGPGVTVLWVDFTA